MNSEKRCDYCGKPNEDIAISCHECGTPLLDTEKIKIEPKRIKGVLNARSANKVLLAYLAVQILAGGGINFFERVTRESHNDAHVLAVFAEWILVPILGILAVVWTSVTLVPRHLRVTSPDGAAWVVGHWLHVVKASFAGFFIGSFFCALDVFMKSHVDWFRMVHRNSVSNQMAVILDLPRPIWTISGLLLAPLLEELLFRGVLYGGYRKSFGPAKAAIYTILMFVGIHCTLSIFYIVSLVGLAAAALWFRLRSKAIGPPIALHAGFNSAITLAYQFPIFSWLVK